MKTKPKLIRVLDPPVSAMVMQHQQHEHEVTADAAEQTGSGTSFAAGDAARDTLYESLVTSRPLAPLAFEAPTGGFTIGSGIGIVGNSHSNSPPGYRVHRTTLHACKPWVAYAMVSARDDGGSGELGYGLGGSSSHHGTNSHADETTWVVIQDSKTRRIVVALSLADLAAEATAFYESTNAGGKASSSSSSSSSSPPPPPPHLGCVSQLTFLDQSSLYWTGFSGNDDGKLKNKSKNNNSWSYLMIHCPNRILIVDLQARGANSERAAPAAVIADVTPKSCATSSGLTSGAAVPISRTGLLLAFADGSLRIYDWKLKTVVRSVRWNETRGKSSNAVPVKGFTDNPKLSDGILRIIPANPYSYDPQEAMTNGGISSKNQNHRKKRQTVICLTKKEVAYLVDVSAIESQPPLTRMEGGSVLTQASEGFLASANASMEHLNFRYDAFRDLFFWANPSPKLKSKLFVWDLAAVMREARPKPQQLVTLQPNPVLVSQFSYEGLSHAVFPGWLHEAFPSDSVASLLVTKDGELQVSVAPLNNTNSSAKNPFPATVVWSVDLPRVMVRDLRLEDRDSYGGETELSPSAQNQPRFRVQSIRCESLQDPSTVFVGTSIGIQVIKLLEGWNGVPSPGTRFAYFNANAGNMGKSVLSVQGGQLSYSPLDPPPLLENDSDLDSSNKSGNTLLAMDRVNPIGKMEYYIPIFSIGRGMTADTIVSSLTGSPLRGNTMQQIVAQKITSVIYESPPPLHLPLEIRNKRSVRNPPRFLASPSGRFVCCLWNDEMRYEVLSVSVLLETVKDKNRNRSSNNVNASHTRDPLVAGGTGITSFAWVGDDDVFVLLYDPEQDEALKAGTNLGAPEASKGGDHYTADKMIKNLGKTYKKGAKVVADTAGKLKTVEGLMDLGKDTGKLGKKGLKGMSRLTEKVAVGMAQGSAAPIKASVGAGKIAFKGTKKRVSKKMHFGWGKKKDKKGSQGALAAADVESDDDNDDEPTTATTPMDIVLDEVDPEAEERAASEQLQKKAPWVELRMLVGSTNEGDETSGSTAISSLGQLALRTGNRNPPTILFGGPVLCVGSKFDESDEGLSYFYTKKKGHEEESASVYVSSGPAFPCPDIVAWDDDGKLCAIVIKGRVSVYLSDEPNFVMLGTVMVASTQSDSVISAKFIHGVLYCTTKTTIRAIFLGDCSGGGACHMDSFTLANCNVPILPNPSIVTDYDSLTPPTIPMPLHHPEVLGYQNGSLVLSTTTGIVAIPLGFPLIRIGTLISAGSDHHSKAEQWFDAVPDCDHEALATFLERRGVPSLALNLNGISLERTIDLCMRYGFVDRLEEVVEVHGTDGIRAIDQSRGLSPSSLSLDIGNGATSLLVCIGAYLLSYGRIELVRRIATECLAEGEEGRKEAFWLAGLLLSVNEADSKRVLQRAVESDDDEASDWVIGPFVRKHVL